MNEVRWCIDKLKNRLQWNEWKVIIMRWVP